MSKRKALATSLDNNPIVRQKMVERLTKAAGRRDIPIAVLHQMAQVLEQWGDDKED